jgi:hypothetical protein
VQPTTTRGTWTSRLHLPAIKPDRPLGHEMRDHLHDKEHLHHLWVASFICAINIAMTVGIPILGLQLLITVGLFGRDAITILAS